MLVIALAGCGGSRGSDDWPLPNHDLASTRALEASGIDRDNVGSLHVAWHFRFRISPGDSGVFTATPVVADGVLLVQNIDGEVTAFRLQ